MNKGKRTKNGVAKIKCPNCGREWLLATATSSLCPSCRWITEIYFDPTEAKRVAQVYNDHKPQLPKSEQAGVRPLIGIDGYAVVFKDPDRLAEVAGKILSPGKR